MQNQHTKSVAFLNTNNEIDEKEISEKNLFTVA